MSRKASSIAKGIAILMLLMHHLFSSKRSMLAHSGGQEVDFSPFGTYAVTHFSLSLKICVAVFVFITAYGTYRQIAKMLDSGEFEAPGAKARLSARYAFSHAAKLLVSFQFIFIIAIAVGCFFPEHSAVAIYGGEGPVKAGFYILADFFGIADMLGTPTFNSTWWYMSLALLLIFLMPALVFLARRIGALPLLMLSFMVPLLASFGMSHTLWRYLPTVALGILCAQYDTFEGMERRLLGRTIPKHVLGIFVCIAILGVLLYLRAQLDRAWLFEALCAFAVCRLAQHFESFDVVFNFLGEYSMNIFFIHTFIYAYFFGPFIYSFGWFGWIFLVLAGISLACSVLIEYVKKWLCVNKLIEWLTAKIDAMPHLAA